MKIPTNKKFPLIYKQIYKKYRSINAFARVLGQTCFTVYNKLQGKRDFALEEMIRWSNLLDIPTDLIPVAFSFDVLRKEVKK